MIPTIHATYCRGLPEGEDTRPSHLAKKAKAKANDGYSGRGIKLIHDATPRERGGFSDGVVFDRQDFREMLNNRSIAPGSVVERDRKRYKVRYTDKGVRLEEVRG